MTDPPADLRYANNAGKQTRSKACATAAVTGSPGDKKRGVTN